MNAQEPIGSLNGPKPGIPIEIADWQSSKLTYPIVYPTDMVGKDYKLLWYPVATHNQVVIYEIRYGTNADVYNNQNHDHQQNDDPKDISFDQEYTQYYFNVQCVMTPPSPYPEREQSDHVESYKVEQPVSYDTWAGIKTASARYMQVGSNRFVFYVTWDPVAKIGPNDKITYFVKVKGSTIAKVSDTLVNISGFYNGGQSYDINVQCVLIHDGVEYANENNKIETLEPVVYVPTLKR